MLLTGDSDGQVSARNGAATIATGRNHVQDIVKGIIEGETRSIVSNMTMEELFNNRRLFEPIGNIPPAEAEANYYAALDDTPMAA